MLIQDTQANLIASNPFLHVGDFVNEIDASNVDTGYTKIGTGHYYNDTPYRNVVFDDMGLPTNATIKEITGGGGGGTVTSITAGDGMLFPDITTSGAVAIDTTKVPYLSGGFSAGLLKWNGSAWVFDSTTLGTVTSVNLSMPSAFSISGNPITTSGTIAVTANGTIAQYVRGDGTLATFPTIPTVTPSNVTASSNKITLGGTPIGASLQPFSIDVNEANLTLNNIGGVLGISKGGINLTALGTANQLLRVNAGATALEYFTPTYGSGTVTSVGLTSSDVTIGGASPITGAGTFTISLINSKITGQLLTGYVSGAGTISATDTILGAIQKLNGNIGAIGLPAVLGNDPTTNNISIISPSGNSNLGITDSSLQLLFEDNYSTVATNQSLLVLAPTYSQLYYEDNNTGKSGEVNITGLQSGLQHDTKIAFDSPVYNFTHQTASKLAYFDISSNLISLGIGSGLSVSGGNLVATGGGGTVTSVGLSTPSAFTVTGSPITTSGTIAITGAGTTAQYIDGTGALQTFPTIPSITGLVPYTGATSDVDLGEKELTTGKLWLYDAAGGPTEKGSLNYADEALHFDNSDAETLLYVEFGFMQLHKTGTIQSNFFTTLLTVNRDHYLPDASGTIALTSNIGTWGALNYPTWSSGTPFVKMTAAGIFSLDTNTYLTGNQSITLSGEASGTGTTSISVTLANSAVIAKVLTGYVSGAGTISATDTILGAIQKLNGNIGALTTGVSSVFGRTGAVTATSGDYTTLLVTENTNLYFTNARAIASTLTGYTSGAGTVSATDTILQAIQKLNGNTSALVTGVSSVNSLTGAVALTGTTNQIAISGANVFSIPSNSQLSIAKITNLTTNGFVKTSGSDGTLSIDTSTYITGNQTITLSGNVTGSGTTAITTTIANLAVTNAMIANTTIDLTAKVTNVLPSGNGGSDAWVDYSGTSTITGWSSFTTKVIRYQQSYKRITVNICLIGTSNANSVSFTLPVATNASSSQIWLYNIGKDSASGYTTKLYYNTAGSTTMAVSNSSSATGVNWTTTGTKEIYITFTYETA